MPLLAFQSPWPYLSAAEEELSMISAGEHWPWKANLAYRIQVGCQQVGELVNVSPKSYHLEMSGEERRVSLSAELYSAGRANTKGRPAGPLIGLK